MQVSDYLRHAQGCILGMQWVLKNNLKALLNYDTMQVGGWRGRLYWPWQVIGEVSSVGLTVQ